MMKFLLSRSTRSAPRRYDVRLRFGLIGAGCTGKTGLLQALDTAVLSQVSPSGLRMDAPDLFQQMETLRRSEQVTESLQVSGLDQTLDARRLEYLLLDGLTPRVLVQVREVVGQVLTSISTSAALELRRHFEEYVRDLVNANVLWVLVPLPPSDATPRELSASQSALKVGTAYLSTVLKERDPRRPVSVAIVATKIDARYADASEAHEGLEPSLLESIFKPLIHTARMASVVTEAAILPVSALGFGNSARLDGRDGHQVVSGAGEFSVGGPNLNQAVGQYKLKPGHVEEPFNLEGLVSWSVWSGLMNHEFLEGSDAESYYRELANRLLRDLKASRAWMIPIKGLLARS